MNFETFCQYLEKIETESSRTLITQVIAEMLNKLEAMEMTEAIYLLKGRIAAEYEPLELNFSDKSLINAIEILAHPSILAEPPASLSLWTEAPKQNSYTIKPSENDYWRKQYGIVGDSGLLAQKFITEAVENQDRQDYSIREMYTKILALASASGKGSQQSKVAIVVEILPRLSALEAKYFARIITGKLRLGMSNKTLLDAISWAKTGDKSLRVDLDRAYGVRADAGKLAEYVLIQKGDLAKIKLEVGVPLAAELVEREKDVTAIINRHPELIAQYKYDGLRAQLHFIKKDGLVKIFSRNMEPLTEMFPDIVHSMQTLKVDSLVLDGEIIGYEQSTDTFLPFQQTIQRKRKYDVEATSLAIPVRYFVFDLLYLNGEDLTAKPLNERLTLLRNLKLDQQVSQISITESPNFTDSGKLETHFRAALDKGLEGLVVKDPISNYRPGQRSYDWIKLKANTFADLKDTVDCVIMGYYFGKGQRAVQGIGGFLMGIYNQEKNVYQTIAKVGSGVKEEEWPVFKAKLDAIRLEKMPTYYQIKKELLPDILVAPQIVSEVDADQITVSKFHTAAVGDLVGQIKLEGDLSQTGQGLGLSLRFPRLKVFARDKLAEDTTTITELVRLYNLGIKTE